MCSSGRSAIPGGIPQFECEAFVGQARNSWRKLLVFMRIVFRSGPKFLAIFSRLNARCLSIRTEIPGSICQFKRELCFGQDRNPWQYSPVCRPAPKILTMSTYLPGWARGVFRSEPKFLAIFPRSNARRFSARTEIPGGISQFKCEALVGQN